METSSERQKLLLRPACAQLAQIAAPFAAAGHSDEQAIAKAISLLVEADRCLMKMEDEETFSAFKAFNLEGVRALFGLKTDRRIREILEEVNPEDAAEIWRRALSGEKAFSRELIDRMKTRRQQLVTARNRKAAEKAAAARENTAKRNRPLLKRKS